ncbi:MAG: hypothetical protein IJF40_06560 [Clostridia bacterium]|nr:hypothetical protein [Clostridia bacterium]
MKKIIISVLVVLILLWGIVAAVDFSRVNDFEKPIFCVPTQTADDGGSGRYVGLGYYFDIEGSFMPENDTHRVTYFDAYLFGIDVLHGIAD